MIRTSIKIEDKIGFHARTASIFAKKASEFKSEIFVKFKEKKVNAKIMVDGSIKYQQSEGSIHKVAAKIIGAESCNGWTFWHYKSGNSLKPIDDLRQRLRPII